MKAMILAAGRGERLRPLTDEVPKPLVSVAGKPLIIYHIERLASLGITDIVINHAWLGHKIVETLGDGSLWGVNLLYSAETEALETGGGIKRALGLLGSEPFLVINGDIFIEQMPDISVLAETALAHLWLVDNPIQHPAGDFVLEGGQLFEQGEPKLTFSGIGIYRPQLFEHIEKEAFPLAPLLRDKMREGKISGAHFNGFWCDVGTLERLQALENSKY